MSRRHAVLLSLLVAGCGGGDDQEPAKPLDPCKLPTPALATPAMHTPRWAFEPWISKDISSGDDMRAFTLPASNSPFSVSW